MGLSINDVVKAAWEYRFINHQAIRVYTSVMRACCTICSIALLEYLCDCLNRIIFQTTPPGFKAGQAWLIQSYSI